MSGGKPLPFSIPLLILDGIGALLMVAGLMGHFSEPSRLSPWALPLAGIGFALTIPFALDVVRRARVRKRGNAAPSQDPVVRRG